MKRLILLAALVAAFSAHATDGVLEINQVKLDAAGGTYVISQPGSYRLTSNLTQHDANTIAIRIAASNVTLDLNGFSIIGPNTCRAGQSVAANCDFVLGAVGIGTVNANGAPYTNYGATTVKNGVISGMGGHCLYLTGKNALVEDVAVDNCGGHGIDAASTALDGVVHRGRATSVYSIGIFGGVITNSVATSLGDFGIWGRMVSNSFVSDSHNGGIAGEVIQGNTVASVNGCALQGLIMGRGLPTANYLEGYDTPMCGQMSSVPPNSNSCNGTAC